MGSIFGGGAATAAAQQDTAGLNQMVGMLQPVIAQMLSDYQTSAAPQLATLAGPQTGAQSLFTSTMGPENQTLSNTGAANSSSMIDTLMSRLGGVANPGALAKSMTTGAAQTNANAAQGLSSSMGSGLMSAYGMDTNKQLDALQLLTGGLGSAMGGGFNLANMYSNAANNASGAAAQQQDANMQLFMKTLPMLFA